MTSISDLVNIKIPEKQLCFFCYKNIVTENQEIEKQKIKNDDIRNFFKFLEEYIGTWEKDIRLPGEKSSSRFTLSKPDNDLWEGSGRCKDCEKVVKTFCELYHQWKGLELQLEWKVKMLTDIMKSANKVPSRVKQLNDMFQEAHVDNVPASTDGIVNKTKLENFKIFRRAITRKCSQKIANATPRVVLKRLGVNSDLQGAPSCSGLKHEVVHNNNDLSTCANNVGVAAFLGWSMSMAAVALLASSSGGVSRMDSVDFTVDGIDDVEEIEKMNESLHPMSPASSFVTEGNLVSFRGSVEVPTATVITTEKQEIVQHDEDFINHVEDHGTLNNNINNEQETAPSLPDSSLHQDDFGDNIVLERNENGGVNVQPIVHSPNREESGNTLGEHGNLEVLPPPAQTTEVKESNYNCQGPSISAGFDVALNENMSKMETIHEEEFEQDSYTSSSSSDDEEELKIEIKEEFTSSINQRQSFHKHLFPCTVCSQMLKSRHGLRIHMIQQHSTSSGNHNLRYYHCKICKTAFKRNSDLRRHKMTKRHQTRRKLFLKSQKLLKMKRTNKLTDSRSKQICVNLSKGEATFANAETIELQQTSLSVNPQVWKEPAIEGAMQVEKEDCRKLKEIITETGAATKNQTVRKKSDKTSPVPQKRYSLRGNRQKSYHDMAIEEEDDPDTTNDTDFQLDDHHDNSLEDQESSSSSESDQDTSSSSEMPDMDTESDEDDAMHKWKNAVKVEKDVEAKRNNASVPVPLIDTFDNRHFICKYCNKVFEKYISCKEHKRNFHKLSHQFICKVKQCLYRFKTLEDLNTHQKLHGEFKCNFCDVVMPFAPDLSLHEMKHSFKPEHGTEQSEKSTAALPKFNCRRCPFSSQVEARYVKHHLKSHLNLVGTVFTCSICGKGAMTDKFLRTHFKTHHKTDGLDASQIWKCDKCSAYFLTNDQLSQHKFRIHNKGSNTCPECSRTHKTRHSLRYHMEELHPNSSFNPAYRCRFAACKRRFSSQRHLDEHISKDHENRFRRKMVKSSECPICEKKMRKIGKHFKKYHDTTGMEPEEIQKCNSEGCIAYFKTAKQLSEHHCSVIHNSQNAVTVEVNRDAEVEKDAEAEMNNTSVPVPPPFYSNDNTQLTCGYCEKVFEKHNSLKEHKWNFHRGTNKFICKVEQCYYRFKTLENLKTHQKLHGKFKCNFCDVVKCFAPDLCLHEVEHAIRPEHGTDKTEKLTAALPKFTCPRCPFNSYLESYYVNHHLKSHLNLGGTVFTCSICGKGAMTEKFLAAHFKTHHKTDGLNASQIWKCDKCSAYFLTNDQLSQHQIEIHDNGSNTECSRTHETRDSLRYDMEKMHPNTSEHHCSVIHNSQKAVKVEVKKSAEVEEDAEVEKDAEAEMNNTSIPVPLPFYSNDNRQITCGDCKKVFEKYNSLKEHKKNCHRVTNKFVCKVKQCLYRFKTLENLKTHQKLHGEFKCNFCDVVKCFAPDLCIHEMEHAFRPEPIVAEETEKSTAVLKKFSCPRCPFNCDFESTYVKHHLKSHVNLISTISTCSICGKEGMTEKFLATHFRLYHKTDGLDASQIWKCDKCSAYFLTNDQLSQHQIEIHNKGSSTCPECSRTYKSRHSLRYHMEKMHPNSSFNPGYRCHFADCERKFSTQGRLDKHISKFHENSSDIRMIKCTKCSKEFKGEQRLKNHMNVVHVIPSFVCSICGKAFKTKHGLAYHMDYHNPETWGFQCSTCGKKLATNQKLEEHMRTHTKEKPFICQFCGEKYAHRHNWRNHMKIKHPDEFAELEHSKDAKKSGNFLSRKGSKKGDVITAGTKA